MGENGEVITATVHKEKEAKDIFDNNVGQPKAGFHEPTQTLLDQNVDRSPELFVETW